MSNLRFTKYDLITIKSAIESAFELNRRLLERPLSEENYQWLLEYNEKMSIIHSDISKELKT